MHGKVKIGFMKPNGMVGSKFEIYNSIEAIHEEQNKPNYASKHHQKNKVSLLYQSNSKKKLTSTVSPLKDRNHTSKSKERNIQISKSSVALDQNSNDVVFRSYSNKKKHEDMYN